jgi:serine/threonine-protein kinase
VEPVKPVVVTPPPVAPQPVTVRFEIDSQPQGATVVREGVQVGVTPFSLTLPREGASPVQVELAFSLEGYEPATVVAQGLDGVVTLNQPLAKKPEPAPVKPPPVVRPVGKKTPKKQPEGYKDDPY